MTRAPIERRLFDRYVFVDWSASAKPNRGKDSIWLATGTIDAVAPPQNPATRAEATATLHKLLTDAAGRAERVLISFDFPYGYPAGFAGALKLAPMTSPWRATWSQLRERIGDSATNANCRFEDAAKLNQDIGSPPGPFWGRPSAFRHPALTWNVSFPFRTRSGRQLRELRHTERRLRAVKRTAFPVWKLAGQGAVGSQVLLGIPRVATLRDDSELASFSVVWPFEAGFSASAFPDRGPFVVHAETWPGVLDSERESHPVRDACQVLALVRWARRLDGEGQLAREFEAPSDLSEEQIDECIREEGWILGATTVGFRPGQRR